MPFYEYQCRACGAQVEVLQKITDAPLKKCPECGQNKLAKLVSAPVFRLKGGGWYETDFKTDKDTKRNLVDSDKDKGEGKADAGGDGKPVDKGEAASGDRAEGQANGKVEAKPEGGTSPKPKPKPAPVQPPRKTARKVAKGRARR